MPLCCAVIVVGFAVTAAARKQRDFGTNCLPGLKSKCENQQVSSRSSMDEPTLGQRTDPSAEIHSEADSIPTRANSSTTQTA